MPKAKHPGHESLLSPPEIIGTATVGERGQVVIPAEVRQMLRLKNGDRLIVFLRGGMLCMVQPKAMRGFIDHFTKLSRQFGRFKS